MHIGILTFHAPHNFGSMLQNYALQQFLIAKGHTVETINLRNEKQKYMYKHPLLKGQKQHNTRLYLARFANPLWMIRECKKWDKFEYFLNKYLYLTKEYKNWNEIVSELNQLNYHAIIVGGDQIWNTKCFDFDWSYFLPDKIQSIKKISYSPSLGNNVEEIRNNAEKISKIKGYLEDFVAISVREYNGSEFLGNILKRNIPVVPDPTILITADIYDKLIGKPIIKYPYLYYYTPSHIHDTEAEDIALEIAKQKGLKVVTSYPHLKNNRGMRQCQAAGPCEFLNLVKYANFIVGRSYHLIIFSIIFHKEFLTVKNGKDPRVCSLLKNLGIEIRDVSNKAERIDKFSQINYDLVDKKLNEQRIIGSEFILESLKS